MVSKKTSEPISTEKRLSPFNCPSCGSMNEIVKTFKNNKEVLECADCHVNKLDYLKKQEAFLKQCKSVGSKPCPECGSKKRYSLVENGKEVNRCMDCDAVL
jgi:Zn ribbon nucleic-acid-binding protein